MKEFTIMALYTGAALVDPLKKAAAEILPGVRFINVLDDSMIADVIREGALTPPVLERIHRYCSIGADMGADLILETCSSVGESVDYLQPFFSVPVLRIDRPMIEQAVTGFARIGVMATLPTTLEPTMKLVNRVAGEKKREVTLANGLADGAFEALCRGDGELHDRLILKKAADLASSCDIIVLAQGSMARMAETLEKETGIPVLGSIRTGLESLKGYLK